MNLQYHTVYDASIIYLEVTIYEHLDNLHLFVTTSLIPIFAVSQHPT